MKKIPIKSGGFAYLMDDQSGFIPGDPCFTRAEWNYVKKLAAAFHDPEEQKSFWETLLEKKRSSTTYLIYDDFPTDLKAQEPMKEGYMVDFVGGIIETLKKEGKLK